MPIQEMSDANLSRRCRRGDPEAWRELIRRHSPMAYRLAVRMLGPGADADDACQEAFLRVHRSFDRFDPTRPLKPWVSRIVYNVCLRRLGATSRKVMEATEPGEFQVIEDERESGPEELAAQGEAGGILREALEGLPAQDRAIVLLRYREGLSVAEVAEATGMPVNTVKTRLHRARGKLRTILTPMLTGS